MDAASIQQDHGRALQHPRILPRILREHDHAPRDRLPQGLAVPVRNETPRGIHEVSDDFGPSPARLRLLGSGTGQVVRGDLAGIGPYDPSDSARKVRQPQYVTELPSQ